MKLEAFLKLSEIPYIIKEFQNPAEGPKGKGPYIEFEGKLMGDSTLIMEFLTKKYDITFAERLNLEQKAISHSFQMMLEERLYWAMVYSRWIEDHNWETLKPIFFGKLPPVVKNVVSSMARKSVVKTLSDQGLGRHTRSEIYEFAKRDIDSIAHYLGDKRYFHGNEIHEIDLCIYSFMPNLTIKEFNSPLKGHVERHSNLMRHTDRITKLLNSKDRATSKIAA